MGLAYVASDGDYCSKSCSFTSIHNFGDSNSDTGGAYAAFIMVLPPNGRTFFGNISGRFCNGRLVIDLIGMESTFGGSLPKPDEFSTALYTFDIGQNDLAFRLQNRSEEEVQSFIPNILQDFYQGVQQLYNEGARFFWIHNTCPIGCLPKHVKTYKPKQGNLDAIGCIKPLNEIAREFNRQLKEQVFKLKKKILSAKFTYIDMYSVKYRLISDSKKIGFASPLLPCCGSLNCGTEVTENTTIYGKSCKHPSKHVSWDKWCTLY